MQKVVSCDLEKINPLLNGVTCVEMTFRTVCKDFRKKKSGFFYQRERVVQKAECINVRTGRTRCCGRDDISRFPFNHSNTLCVWWDVSSREDSRINTRRLVAGLR